MGSRFAEEFQKAQEASAQLALYEEDEKAPETEEVPDTEQEAFLAGELGDSVPADDDEEAPDTKKLSDKDESKSKKDKKDKDPDSDPPWYPRYYGGGYGFSSGYGSSSSYGKGYKSYTKTVQFNDEVPEEANVVYVGEELPESVDLIVPNSIFLAGPTPRHTSTKGATGGRVRIPTNNTWRPRAIRKLTRMGFDGHIFVPETEDWDWFGEYDTQIQWEWYALGCAACVVFWVPRQLDVMPAFTTNVEFGFCMALKPDRMVFGAPHSAPRNRYLQSLSEDQDVFCEAFGLDAIGKIPTHTRLTTTLETAMKIAAR